MSGSLRPFQTAYYLRTSLRLTLAVGFVAWLAPVLLLDLSLAPSLLLFAVLVVTPLGLTFCDPPNRNNNVSTQWRVLVAVVPAAALALVASLFFDPGLGAGLLALPQLLVGLLAVWLALGRLLPRGRWPAAEVWVDIALAFLAIGTAWLVIWRFGADNFGYGEHTAIVTALHFHYAGFGLMLVAAMIARGAQGHFDRNLGLGVSLGVVAVAVGIQFSSAVEVAGAVLLALAAIGVAFAQARRALGHFGATRLLLAAGSVCLFGAMGLAIVYALSSHFGDPILRPDTMLSSHGLLNSIGFVLPSLIAWRLISPKPQSAPTGIPFSQIAARWRVGPNFLESPATTDTPRGLVDSFDVYARNDFDTREVPIVVRDFYEHTHSFTIAVTPHWRSWCLPFLRFWSIFARSISQLELPRDATAGQLDVESRIVPVSSQLDARTNVRGWVRTYARRGVRRTMYVAIYRWHSQGGQTYMNIAFPLPGGNLASILRLDGIGNHDSSELGVELSVVDPPQAPGDAGIYFVSRLGAIRLPMREVIRVWTPQMSSAPLDLATKHCDADLLARHELAIFGIPYLTLDYVISRPGA